MLAGRHEIELIVSGQVRALHLRAVQHDDDVRKSVAYRSDGGQERRRGSQLLRGLHQHGAADRGGQTRIYPPLHEPAAERERRLNLHVEDAAAPVPQRIEQIARALFAVSESQRRDRREAPHERDSRRGLLDVRESRHVTRLRHLKTESHRTKRAREREFALILNARSGAGRARRLKRRADEILPELALQHAAVRRGRSRGSQVLRPALELRAQQRGNARKRKTKLSAGRSRPARSGTKRIDAVVLKRQRRLRAAAPEKMRERQRVAPLSHRAAFAAARFERALNVYRGLARAVTYGRIEVLVGLQRAASKRNESVADSTHAQRRVKRSASDARVVLQRERALLRQRTPA